MEKAIVGLNQNLFISSLMYLALIVLFMIGSALFSYKFSEPIPTTVLTIMISISIFCLGYLAYQTYSLEWIIEDYQQNRLGSLIENECSDQNTLMAISDFNERLDPKILEVRHMLYGSVKSILTLVFLIICLYM